MVPGMPDKPEDPGPNPQSCDIDYSQSRERDHHGCLDHFQEGQEGHFQVLKAQEGYPGLWGVSKISVLWTFLWWNLVMASVL